MTHELNSVSTALVSHHCDENPQATTLPSFLSAAKAQAVE